MNPTGGTNNTTTPPADGALSLFCGAGCVAVAHGATLAEGRSRPDKEKQHECGQTELHLTPRCRIRNASGKKMHISLHLRGLRRKTPFKTCRDPVLTESNDGRPFTAHGAKNQATPSTYRPAL